MNSNFKLFPSWKFTQCLLFSASIQSKLNAFLVSNTWVWLFSDDDNYFFFIFFYQKWSSNLIPLDVLEY